MVFLKSILAGIGGAIAALIVLLIAVIVIMVLKVHGSDLDSSSGIGWDPISLRDFRVLAYLAIAFVMGFLLAWRKLRV